MHFADPAQLDQHEADTQPHGVKRRPWTQSIMSCTSPQTRHVGGVMIFWTCTDELGEEPWAFSLLRAMKVPWERPLCPSNPPEILQQTQTRDLLGSSPPWWPYKNRSWSKQTSKPWEKKSPPCDLSVPQSLDIMGSLHPHSTDNTQEINETPQGDQWEVTALLGAQCWRPAEAQPGKGALEAMAANKTRTFRQQEENSGLPMGIFLHLSANLNLREVRVVQEALGILAAQKVPRKSEK